MPPIEQQITFLYTTQLAESAHFYEAVMGFRLVRDQGTCRIYQVQGDAYLGICQREDALVDQERRTLIFTLVTPDVDGWYEHLGARGVSFDKPPEVNPRYNIYHCFLRDPNGYLIEIQRFLD
ncbi:MAG: glyoxalase [Anaerolineaceae bacterium]|nr:glyoxalase [Anaerolineaceae bacterium]